MPTTAMNIFKPTLFSTHKEDSGICPKVGRLLRHQPNTNPAIKAPPLVLRLIGTPPIWIASAPMIPPSKMPSPTNVISVALVGRSMYPSSFAADSTSFFRPTNSRVSPQSIVVCAKTGISMPARLIRRILTPCIKL